MLEEYYQQPSYLIKLSDYLLYTVYIKGNLTFYMYIIYIILCICSRLPDIMNDHISTSNIDILKLTESK
jgi:hypothetical protein